MYFRLLRDGSSRTERRLRHETTTTCGDNSSMANLSDMDISRHVDSSADSDYDNNSYFDAIDVVGDDDDGEYDDEEPKAPPGSFEQC